jgi:hypothetical protein
VPPNIRAALTALLPPYMRGGVIPAVPLSQANPLRIGSTNTATEKPVFALADAENKIFGSVKTTKKPIDDVEKAEVCIKNYNYYLFCQYCLDCAHHKCLIFLGKSY